MYTACRARVVERSVWNALFIHLGACPLFCRCKNDVHVALFWADAMNAARKLRPCQRGASAPHQNLVTEHDESHRREHVRR